MQKFFIVLSVLLALFTWWCGWTGQPRETCGLNLLNTMLSMELIRLYGKKEKQHG